MVKVTMKAIANLGKYPSTCLGAFLSRMQYPVKRMRVIKGREIIEMPPVRRISF